MRSEEVRQRFLNFFEKRRHAVTPSASLVPENDPTTLFTSSGMQPMVPYLLGEKHPKGVRLANSQKCFRSVDIEEVGDNRHSTFFEMLGNWSLGDYFKEEQLKWCFEFLTEEVQLNPEKLFVTCFIGDKENNIPKDEESAKIWSNLFSEKNIEAGIVDIGSEEGGYKRGIKEGERIFFYDSKKNWWSRAGVPENMPSGEPGGPDSEVFYLFDDVEHDPSFGEHCHPNCDCGRFLEIGNNVFMVYKKLEDGSFVELEQKNVDFGGGLERISAASIDNPDIFEVDVLKVVIEKVEGLSGKNYQDQKDKKPFRVVADHLRAAVFMIADGITPSNTDRGYILRRLIRRAVRFADVLGIPEGKISETVDLVAEKYKENNSSILENVGVIKGVIETEEEKFRKTLNAGLKQFEKISSQDISGKQAFELFSTYGFPIDMTLELAEEKGIEVDVSKFKEEFKKHQELSKSGAGQKFKGGLVDSSEETVKLHTAHHLLLSALQKVLGENVKQRGSNITPERLRIDFLFERKMTDEEKQKVESQVNEWISQGLSVVKREMKREEAEKIGAEMEFGAKYPDIVSVYFIEDKNGDVISKEFCGGPHVGNTSELGVFKIKKEESVSAGVRRIKAILG